MENMKLVCEGSTGGGPVAIMTISSAQRWNGGWGDYFSVTGERKYPLQRFQLGERCSGCVFYQVDDGDFLVYCDENTILVLNETYTPDASRSLSQVLPDYEPYIIPGSRLALSPFGGRVVVFEAVYPGNLISRKNIGCQSIKFPESADGHQRGTGKPNAVVVEVSAGSWAAAPLHRRDDLYAFDGVVFYHLRS
jgi:hypothetical protein